MIYIRAATVLTDEQILEMFECDDYQRATLPVKQSSKHIVIGNDSEWIHIADDFGYTLWHNPNTQKAIVKLSKSYDIFQNWIGDIDDSFAFSYFESGKCVRAFEYQHDPFKNTKVITTDSGKKLSAEPNSFDELMSSAFKMLPGVTRSLGIIREDDPLKHRVYGCLLERIIS